MMVTLCVISIFLGVGSNHISSDMARFLNTPLKVAEIKIKFGKLFRVRRAGQGV